MEDQFSGDCHLFVILARNKPKAVIFRRGPSRWVRLIAWDTQQDIFELGQWFKGRIYERRCDLSPNGNKLIYFAQKINGKTLNDSDYTYAWTAISKPPYFTALALWPKGDCWHGGGLFEGKSKVWLNHHPDNAIPHKKHLPPRGLKVIANPDAHGEDSPIYFKRLERDGWKFVQEGIQNKNDFFTFDQPMIWERPDPSSHYTLSMAWAGMDFKKSGGPYRLTFSVKPSRSTAQLPIDADTWADWDQQGRLVYVKEGRLYAAKVSDAGIDAQLLVDFTAQKPEPVAPALWAKTWGFLEPEDPVDLSE